MRKKGKIFNKMDIKDSVGIDGELTLTQDAADTSCSKIPIIVTGHEENSTL